jgi:hypothetical protein
MKKRMIMILVATCFMVVSGCGAAGVSQEVKTAETAADTQTVSEIQQPSKLTTAMDGMEIKDVLDNNPSSIILYGFDEKKYEISDDKDVETIIDILKNVSYKEKDQQDYEEGLYLLDIIYESKTISLGIGSDCVSYGGIQYETEKGSLDEVVNIFTKYLD